MKVLITGGSRGIGKSIAETLCSAGHDVLIASQNAANIEKTVQELRAEFPVTVLGKVTNLAEETDIDLLYDFCHENNYIPNVLVLNAGVFLPGGLTDSDTEDFHTTMNINFFHVYHCVKKFIPILKSQNNVKIIVIGSTAGTYAYPSGTMYGVSKWALRGYVINLRQELKKDNIAVTLINPGPTVSDIWGGLEIEAGRRLEASDIGKLTATLLTLSPQAVVEEINVAPMLGDIF